MRRVEPPEASEDAALSWLPGPWLGRAQSGRRLPPSGHPERHRNTGLAARLPSQTENPAATGLLLSLIELSVSADLARR